MALGIATAPPSFIRYLLLILPFLAGGFHTSVAIVTTPVLLISLIQIFRTQGFLKVVLNLQSIACFAVTLGYCITPLWAADRGMAMMGILRFLPLPLLVLLLMQYTQTEKAQFLKLLPITGIVMTLLSCMLWFFPATQDSVTVNNRLSGFLQYPNSFAAFLLVGIAVQSAKKHSKISDWLMDLILIAGIILSGSRTGVLLLFFVLLVIAIFHKKIHPLCILALAVSVGICGTLLFRSEQQITFLGRDIGSLFVRVLYYKDALPVILRHPFGLGYLGYRALETTFQASRYTVSFVHSGLLQLLLDIGWIPALMLLSAVCKTLVSAKTAPARKMVLLVLSTHCLIDFDLEFFLFWAILLLCMDFEEGKVSLLKSHKFATAATAVILGVCLWLGIGELLYQSGNSTAALKVTPFHTDALASELKRATDPDELDSLADQILALNPTHALAYSAKANAAYSRGQVLDMIQYKETVLTLTPYTTEEYCDYIEKLYTVLELYVRNGDMESASYCLTKLLAVPDMIEAVAARTDPLADKTSNDTELILPDSYQTLLSELEKANPGL